jgi:NADP-dependent 3-hydroxy acid dehydrogenase YdfG
MFLKSKTLQQQIIFLTQATSSIGIATLFRAVEQGAKVFFTDTNKDELQNLHEKLIGEGYETEFCALDSSQFGQFKNAVDLCVKTFGRIDTFINISSGHDLDINSHASIKDAKHVFDQNFWSVVFGTQIAIDTMKQYEGKIINVVTNASGMASPWKETFSALLQAVKTFTDVKRKEVLLQHIPLYISLIISTKNGSPSIKYPFAERDDAIGLLKSHPTVNLAKAILECSIKSTQELKVSEGSFYYPFLERFSLLWP